MTLLAHYQMFGRYNAWANGRLYDAAARLGREQYRADRGTFFKSVHGTLNHLLATDRIWMQRFTGTGTAPDRLDAILFERWTNSAPPARPRTGASSISSTAWMMPGLPASSGTAGYRRRKSSNSPWRPRWRIGSITRPIIAARCTRC